MKVEEDPAYEAARLLQRHEKIDMDVYDTRSRNWKRRILKDKKRACRVHEQVSVSLKLKNSINVDIVIDKIRLLCDFTRSKKPAAPKEGQEEEEEEEEITTSAEYKAHSLSLTLGAFEERTLLLEVTPLALGELHIRGVEWVLFKEVSCTYMFQTERLFPPNYFII